MKSKPAKSSNRVVRIALITTAILLIPLVAMQFNDEVNWTLGDFVVMGVLLFVTGLAVNFAIKAVVNAERRVWAILVIVAVFLFIWAELAVGVIGTPFAGS